MPVAFISERAFRDIEYGCRLCFGVGGHDLPLLTKVYLIMSPSLNSGSDL